jgi:hypothetical protein
VSRPAGWTPDHEAGSALILAVLDAALNIRKAMIDDPYSPPDLMELRVATDLLDGALAQLLPRQVWRPSTWGEVAKLGTGTRVRLGTVEAVVETASVSHWHVDPQSSEYRPRPLEHDTVTTRLVGRDQLYQFPPTGPVEVLDVEWPEVDLAGWTAAAGACLEVRALEVLKRELGAQS